jgi:hypothetical protein
MRIKQTLSGPESGGLVSLLFCQQLLHAATLANLNFQQIRS